MSDDRTGLVEKVIGWRDVDLSDVDWNEIWAMVAEVEDTNDCSDDSCML